MSRAKIQTMHQETTWLHYFLFSWICFLLRKPQLLERSHKHSRLREARREASRRLRKEEEKAAEKGSKLKTKDKQDETTSFQPSDDLRK
jgi:hypothetical protein